MTRIPEHPSPFGAGLRLALALVAPLWAALAWLVLR